MGFRVRIIAYTSFLIAMLLLAPYLSLRIPSGSYAHGWNQNYLGDYHVKFIAFDSTDSFLGIHLTGGFAFTIWDYKEQFSYVGSNEREHYWRTYNQPQNATSANWSPSGGLIGVTANQTNSFGSFYIMDTSDLLDYKPEIPILNYQSFTWAQNLTSIYFGTFDKNLYHWNSATSEFINLTRNRDSNIIEMKISPSGTSLVYLEYIKEGFDDSKNLAISNLFASEFSIANITNEVGGRGLQWAYRDGVEVLYYTKDSTFFAFNPLTNSSSLIIADINDYLQIEVSPNSEYIVVTEENSLNVLDKNGNLLRKMDFSLSNEYGPIAINHAATHIAMKYSDGIEIRDIEEFTVLYDFPSRNMYTSGTYYIEIDLLRFILAPIAVVLFFFLELVIYRVNRSKRIKDAAEKGLYPEP